MSNMSHGIGADAKLQRIIDQDLGLVPPDSSSPIANDLQSIEASAEEKSLQDIYKDLVLHEDIILVIDAIDEIRVRKGLSSIKAKENAKLRDNDIPTDNTTLEFIVHKEEELAKQKRIKLQIFLKQRPMVKVHRMIVSDDL